MKGSLGVGSAECGVDDQEGVGLSVKGVEVLVGTGLFVGETVTVGVPVAVGGGETVGV